MPLQPEPIAAFGPAPPASSLSSPSDRPALQRTRIWDLPTRLFHWTLAASVLGSFATGLGGAMEWHFRLGYAVLALLAFRLVWGFVGGRWSRFVAFLYGPRPVLDYLRGRSHPDHLVGHNPLGAFSVFALLALLALQVASGLVSDDEIASAGPLVRFVSGETVSLASGWHGGWGKWLLIALVSLHLLAVLYHALIKRHVLVLPMLTGDKDTPATVAPSRDDTASRTGALVLFALCIGLAAWIASLRP